MGAMSRNLPIKQRIVQALLLLVLATPLVMLPSTFYFPFSTTKAWFFRAVILATLFACVFFSKDLRAIKPKNNLVAFAVLFFLLIYAVTTATSIDVHRSFWGNYERMMGLVTMIYFVVYFFLLRTFFFDKQSWRWFWGIFGGVGIVVFLLGLYQSYNPDFLIGRQFGGNHGYRENITLGNPLYVGQYSVYLLFLGLYWLKDTFDRWRIDKSRVKELWFWGAAVFSSLGLLYLSQTRSSFVGLVMAVFCGCALMALLHQKKRDRRIYLIAFVLMSLVAAFILSPLSQSVTAHLGKVNRFTDLNFLSSSNINRIHAWKTAATAWKDRAFLGWGPGTFSIAYNQYFDSRRLIKRDFTDTWFDSSHNQYLDALSEQGVLGFVALLFLYASVLIGLMVACRRGHIKLIDMMMLVGLLITVGVTNIFVFEQVTSYFSLFSFLAFVSFIIDGQKNDFVLNRSSVPIRGALLYGSVIILSVVSFYTVIIPARANATVLSSLLQVVRTGSVEDLLLSAEQATRSGFAHHEHNYSKLAELLLKTAYIPQEHLQPMISLYRFTIEGLQEQMKKHPRDVSLPMLIAPVLHDAYRVAPALFPRGRERGDQYFVKASELSPNRQEILAYWGNQIMQSGNLKDAREPYVRALAMAPSSPISFNLYADYVMAIEENPSKALHLYEWGIKERLVDINSKRLVDMVRAVQSAHGKQQALERLDVLIYCFTHGGDRSDCGVYGRTDPVYGRIDPIPSFMGPLYDLREELVSST